MSSLGISEACRKLARLLAATPHCIRKMSSTFALGGNSYLKFCLVFIRPSLEPLMPWSWALLISHPRPVPSPLLCPSLGNVWRLQEGSFALTHYLFLQIFCLNTGVLSVPQEAQAFETQKPSIHSFFQLSLGPSFPETMNAEGPEDWMGEELRARRTQWAQ